ncbi:Phospholipid/glycerol acyltransferase protein [Azotobacter vinelandii CA]|uniref:Phospholipid/glycerol acyltransferase protein n=3 Tax=Azotobacter vinelandii TaxID=354 RepID=C1DS46_AZOVD|nr:lysophospholipid acyltransferase family protein [Azotobacter vinelandii]ACO79921.1 Phospholipid/glycerol acyltransferase protein [Azotobacter vinelandii DJ]AGK14541.1 Phospholipid/glycerol acyltransferase protein [Azotobacter vinelandii CA]AGK21595.1 Phospholipid/glycerol acyltransferase protein [Azotobacter vinelandii CA6]WKN20672.1 1-acyl-sn-glycerol-3-phosphate acyltransferase [Azotobacter vinelandii]SFX45282.1 lyso-ornithine lipid acyltransferase [Azotobacter vinelandii]
MKKLHFHIRLYRLLVVLAFGLVMAGGVSLLERFRRDDLMALRQRLTRRFLVQLAAALPFRLSLHGKLPDRPMLWVSNHVSWTDIPLLGGLVPLSFLSKAEVRSWPLAGWLAHKAGTLFIRRGAGDSGLVRNQLLRHLHNGHDLLIFPEGTTTDGRSLRGFHSRLLASAVESRVPVQPVAIRYLRDGATDPVAPFIGDDDLLSHLLRLLRSERSEVEIHLLPPLDSQGLSRTELGRQAHTAIARCLFGDRSALPVAA